MKYPGDWAEKYAFHFCLWPPKNKLMGSGVVRPSVALLGWWMIRKLMVLPQGSCCGKVGLAVLQEGDFFVMCVECGKPYPHLVVKYPTLPHVHLEQGDRV